MTRHRRAIAISALTLALGCSQPPVRTDGPAVGSQPAPSRPDPPGSGKVGAICRCGERATPACKAEACAADLVCGYGCGIPGCDSTCMTAEEFERSKTIP